MATQWPSVRAQEPRNWTKGEGRSRRSRRSESKTIEQCATFAIQMQLRVIIDSVSTQEYIYKTKKKRIKKNRKKLKRNKAQ